jgi:hypothetical protein
LIGPLLFLSQPNGGGSGIVEPDSYAGRGIQLLVGHFNGNLPAERAANLSQGELGNIGEGLNKLEEELAEELDANGYSPRPGAGEKGRPVELSPAEEIQSERTFGINQVLAYCMPSITPIYQYTILKFNLLASDSIALNRSLPDVRRRQCQEKKVPPLGELADTSVIIVFHNEVIPNQHPPICAYSRHSPPWPVLSSGQIDNIII